MAGNSEAPPVRFEPNYRARLHLLDRLELRCDGAAVFVPDTALRVLAFLALRDRYQHRSVIAGTLWTDTTEKRAAASLRTALWRIRRVGSELVAADGFYLRIGDSVKVDLTEVTDAARLLVADPQSDAEPAVTAETLSKELLPDWHDDWVILERERLRQVRLHGLEALCRRLSALGRHALAIEAGMLAVAIEPLRETTQRVLISAHLGHGNVSEARRQYNVFRHLLQENLGIEPGDELRALVAACR